MQAHRQQGKLPLAKTTHSFLLLQNVMEETLVKRHEIRHLESVVGGEVLWLHGPAGLVARRRGASGEHAVLGLVALALHHHLHELVSSGGKNTRVLVSFCYFHA